MRLLLLASVLYAVAATAATVVPRAAQAQRTYWKATVARLAAGGFPHTHVELDSVLVDYTRIEGDSDLHIRLRDPRDTVPEHVVIAECIPKLPCRRPKVGEIISVLGILRYDAEHGWAEVHPVERLVPLIPLAP